MEHICNRLRAFCPTNNMIKKCLELVFFSQKYSFYQTYFTGSYFTYDKFAIILIVRKVAAFWTVFIFITFSLCASY